MLHKWLFLGLVSLSSFLPKADLLQGMENSYPVELPAIERPDPELYLSEVREDLYYTQNHNLCIPPSQLVPFPATALIVGSGTIGLQSAVLATKVLPVGSTIVMVQNDIEDKAKLEAILREEIQNGRKYRFVVSDPIDIGRLDLLEQFMDDKKDLLSTAVLFVHAADKAKRYLPDATPIKDVLAQAIRRASVAVISQMLDKTVKEFLPLVKIIVSSECAQNRDNYRIPNLGPYQFGKVFGDELFKGTRGRTRSIDVIAYSGPMMTQGQKNARSEEYRLLKGYGIDLEAESVEDFIDQHRGTPDIDPMESVGVMFLAIFKALKNRELEKGCLYKIYGTSVCTELGQPVNTMEKVEAPPYLWPLLETPHREQIAL